MNDEIYIGSTGDLKRRVEEHNNGREPSTRRYMPWKVLYYETYEKENFARLREKKLKHHGNALRELKKRIGLIEKNKSGAGFTLVELMVTVVIFSIIIGASTGVFVSAIKLQRYNLTHQQLLNQTSYVIEYIARAIRMAQRDDDGTCISLGKNYRLSEGNTKIEFMNSSGDCQIFYLDTVNNRLMENKTGYVNPIPITSNDFKVDSFKIALSGDDLLDTDQPRVTIFMEIEGQGSGSQPRLKMQTTISQRNLDK